MTRDYLYLNKPWFLYVAEMPTYGATHPTKIGIAVDVARRLQTLGRQMASMTLMAQWQFPDRLSAQKIETAIIHKFDRFTLYERITSRELLNISYPIVIAMVKREMSSHG